MAVSLLSTVFWACAEERAWRVSFRENRAGLGLPWGAAGWCRHPVPVRPPSGSPTCLFLAGFPCPGFMPGLQALPCSSAHPPVQSGHLLVCLQKVGVKVSLFRWKKQTLLALFSF